MAGTRRGSSGVEHGTENAGVDSSILSLGTINIKAPYFVANFLPKTLSSLPFAGTLLTFI